MEMTKNLGMYSELVPGASGLGHIPRKMSPQDSTDGGISSRIMQAVQQGMISQEAGKYLIENLLDDDQTTRQALRGMPSPRNMPPMDQVEPYSMMRGLLGD